MTLPLRIHRVNQLDAERLDEELRRLLNGQLGRVVQYLPGAPLQRWAPELEALLRGLVWSFTMRVDRPSPGLMLQNLQYRDETKVAKRAPRVVLHASQLYHRLRWGQKLGNLIGDVLLPLAWARAAPRWVADVWRIRLEALYRVLRVTNLLVFLHDGRYRSVLDRILRTRLVYLFPRISRQVAFDFMNQQLVWGRLSEFVLFILPLLNIGWLLSYLRQLFSSDSSSMLENELHESTCPVCEANPITTPVTASCGHLFCYYCLKGSRLADPQYRCPVCDQRIVSQKMADVS